MKVEILWIIMAVIFSQRDGSTLSLSYVQTTQRFMKDLNSGRYFFSYVLEPLSYSVASCVDHCRTITSPH